MKSTATTLEHIDDDPTYTLNECEADCDIDDDCDGDLLCFQRDSDYTDYIPGCDGTPEYWYDYCYAFPDFTETDDGYILIQHQGSGSYFTDNDDGMEHYNLPDSDTYCAIGYVEETDYLFDEGKYWFRLIY